MASRVESLSEFDDRDPSPMFDVVGRIIWMPDHLDGQLTLPGYPSSWKPDNEEIILEAVRNGQLDPEIALNEIAALSSLANLALQESLKSVE